MRRANYRWVAGASFLSAVSALTLCLGAGLLGTGCSAAAFKKSPSLRGDVALAAGLSLGPAAGFSLGISQRLIEKPEFDLHVEIELHRQRLDAVEFEGERLDGNWDQVRGGLKLNWPSEDTWDWTGRFGITWVRPVGDPVFVDKPADFGGFHLGVGKERKLGPRVLFSPDLALIGLFEESDGESGLGVQLSLRFLFLP